MRSPIICLVTGDHGHERPLLERIAVAARAGVDLIQIRERRFDDRSLFTLTRRARDLTRGTATRIVVNDRADVALAAGAAGLHLRATSFDASRVRPLVPEGFIIGRSVHTRAEAQSAEADGCDYLLFGTVFHSSRKPPTHAVAGLDALRDVCRAVRLPVLAIGGVSLDNARDALTAGASGIAGIGLFENAAAVVAIVSQLRERFDT